MSEGGLRQNWDTLVAEVAKERGISEPKARALLSVVSAKEGLGFMDQVGQYSPVLKQLDPGAQQAALQLMAAGSVRPQDDMGELKKMAREMVVLREMLRPEAPTTPQTDPAMKEQLAGLTKKLEEMRDEESKRRLSDIEKAFADKMDKMESALTAKIEASAPGASADEKSSMVRALEELKAFRQAEKEWKDEMGVKDTSSEGNITAALEQAKKLGYRIEGPKTLDDIEREVREQVKKAKEDAVRETELKLKSDDKKMSLLVSLGQAALDGILPALIEGAPGAVAPLEAAKNALKAASAGT